MFLRILIGVLLVLHGVVHGILAMIPNPNAAKPVAATFFSEWARPWLQSRLSGRALQTIAIALAVIAMLGFVAAGLALFGVLVPFDWWRALAIASAVVSLLLVIIFWHPYLIVGLLIDGAVLVTLIFTKWSPG